MNAGIIIVNIGILYCIYSMPLYTFRKTYNQYFYFYIRNLINIKMPKFYILCH